jgi:hypothetical protein
MVYEEGGGEEEVQQCKADLDYDQNDRVEGPAI